MATENYENPWPAFQAEYEPEETTELSSVAAAVLEAYDIEMVDEAGGTLKNVDLKRVGALNALKASLLEELALKGGGLREVSINAYGQADFYEVGAVSSVLNPYYSLKSESYLQPEVGVMITGGKPRQERIDHPWFPLVVNGESNSTIHDTSLLSTGCTLNNISTHAVVTYEDPVRHSGANNWGDGVKSTFDIDDPFQRIIGYTWKIIPPEEYMNAFVTIKKQSQSSVPVLLAGSSDYTIGDVGNYPNIGTLKKRKLAVYDAAAADGCDFFDDEIQNCSESSVELLLGELMKEGISYTNYRGTTINKYVNTQGLFMVGIKLQACYGVAKENSQKKGSKQDNTNLYVSSKDAYRSVIKLREKTDYITLYDSDSDSNTKGLKLPCFQLANNLRHFDQAKVGTGAGFFISYYSDSLLDIFGARTGTGTVFPMEGTAGMLVEQLWAQVLLDTPCFQIIDPLGNAYEIANELKVYLKPLSLLDEPAPIAVNGELVDQRDKYEDNDPTTVQKLQQSQLELAQIEASKGRTLHLNLASLDEDATVRLSSSLYSLMLDDDGTTWSHTCPPTDEPILGSKGPNGGTINEIEYSYTDSNNYLINVIEGPTFFGDFAGISGGIYLKKTETLASRGVVKQDYGNNVHYKVYVDGYGEVTCINSSGAVINKGDRVSVTVYNNPVEE